MYIYICKYHILNTNMKIHLFLNHTLSPNSPRCERWNDATTETSPKKITRHSFGRCRIGKSAPHGPIWKDYCCFLLVSGKLMITERMYQTYISLDATRITCLWPGAQFLQQNEIMSIEMARLCGIILHQLNLNRFTPPKINIDNDGLETFKNGHFEYPC